MSMSMWATKTEFRHVQPGDVCYAASDVQERLRKIDDTTAFKAKRRASNPIRLAPNAVVWTPRKYRLAELMP